MNCKPKQRAWINVPRTPDFLAMGLDQIHGHVVQTVSLHPESPFGEPQWIVEPPQRCVVPRDVRCRSGLLKAGTVFNFQGVPDAMLRPFDDFPPEELDDLVDQLQRELVS